MAWSVQYLPDCAAIETRYAGTITPQELKAAVLRTMDLAREHDTTLLLGDCTELHGGHDIVDLYGIVQLVVGQGLPRVVHEAIVMPQMQSAARDVEFWRTAARNRGLDVTIVKTREEGLAWLAAQPAPSKAGPAGTGTGKT